LGKSGFNKGAENRKSLGSSDYSHNSSILGRGKTFFSSSPRREYRLWVPPGFLFVLLYDPQLLIQILKQTKSDKISTAASGICRQIGERLAAFLL
jgi:hypothetical protein